MKMMIEAMRLRMPAIAKGFQSITFINNPAMLHRNAVAAMARIPALLLGVSIPLFRSPLRPPLMKPNRRMTWPSGRLHLHFFGP
ncbi:MAG: hypothetical protein R6X07_14465 [Desulfatiglandales bacterium]